ncbi:MAG: hypothetical protein KatS3mg092_0456 [Patescibacteria group bacterium]|nr:MAG: hypothetical protein KatS3mg092_0456 [Patescibacteria group bacterium]
MPYKLVFITNDGEKNEIKTSKFIAQNHLLHLLQKSVHQLLILMIKIKILTILKIILMIIIS